MKDNMSYFSLESMWDKEKLKKVQDKACKLFGIYSFVVDEYGYPLTDMSGTPEEVEIINKAIDSEQFERIFKRVSGKSLEDQVIEDTDYRNIKLAAVRISGSKYSEISWIVIAQIAERCEETPVLAGLTRIVSEDNFYRQLELLRYVSRIIIEAKTTAAEANLQNVKSQSVSENLSEDLKRIGALTEVVQLLDCDKPVEEVFDIALKHAGEYLGVSSAQVFRLNRDGETMDILAEWVSNGVTSIFDRTKNVEKSPLLYGEKAVIISSNTALSSTERKLMDEAHIRARASFPIMIGKTPAMYVFFAECKKERQWSADEIRFMNDVVQVMQSILEKRIQKNSLVGSYASLEMILDHVGSAILVQDAATGRVLFANKVLKSTFESMLLDGSLSTLFQEVEGDANREHREIFCKQNSKFYELYTTSLNWVDGSPAVLYAAYDITEKRLYQQKIEQQAYTDFLTGLFNRMCCERDLAVQIDRAKKYGKKGAILYIDLDDFKHINDGLGHQYGDILLQTIAKNVRRISGVDGAFYRMGGDEFVIIITIDAYPKMEQVVDEVKTIFSKPWFLKDADYYCTMSMGVVEFPGKEEGIHELIKKADVAMYEAKRGGKNRVVYYSDQLSDESNKRLDMEKNMRNASNGDFREFEVYFQPLVDITQKGNPIVAAEALIRWNSVELGFITPDVFIPLAEYLGLINPIGSHVLRESCMLLRSLNDNGFPDFKISVNLSVVQLLQNDIVESIEKVVTETGIDPRNLTLEVTESLAINDMRRMKRILGGIKKLGIGIALDDFGTGYSSLNHVREIPLDIIKVDQSFVRELDVDSYSRAFVKMVAELAESIGVSVCVEGVERKEQFDEITNMRVKMIQGFYFGKPMKKQELVDLLNSKN